MYSVTDYINEVYKNNWELIDAVCGQAVERGKYGVKVRCTRLGQVLTVAESRETPYGEVHYHLVDG